MRSCVLRALALVLVLSSPLGGCSDDVGTQVLVHFDADDASRARAASVRVTVVRDGGAPEVQTESVTGPDARVSFPFTQPLQPGSGGATAGFQILGELLDDAGAAFAEQRAIGAFREGQRLHVWLRFEAGCLDRLDCGDRTTCVAGECAPACVEPSSDEAGVSRSEPIACPGVDAGMPDAGVDWTIPDWPSDWPCAPAEECDSARVVFRSIGARFDPVATDTGATIDVVEPTHVTFTVDLPPDVGTGDQIVFPPSTEELFVLGRVDDRRLVLQQPPTSASAMDAPFEIRRAYTSLPDWEEGQGGDLSTRRTLEVGVCYADAPLRDEVIIDGSTTDIAHYLMLTAAPGHRHHGVGGAGVQVIPDPPDPAAPEYVHAIEIRDDFTRIQWLSITGWADEGQDADAIHVLASDVTIESLLIEDEGYETGGPDPEVGANGISLDQPGATLTIRNTFIHDVARAGILVNRVNDTRVFVENTTVVGCKKHMYSEYLGCVGMYDGRASVMTLRNVIAYGIRYGRDGECMNPLQAGAFFLSGAIDGSTPADMRCSEENQRRGHFDVMASSNNMSDDDTAPGADSIQNVSSGMFTTDLHLPDGSPAIGAGRALTDEPALARDIDEELRPTSGPWDIGADQRSAP